QFRKPHRHDGSNMHMDQHMMDGNNQMMPQDGMGRNNGQMPPQGQPSQGYQPNGNASEQAPNGETQAQ
ncbi:MAG: transcriptional regulator, partial [Veillonella sp.]|nr:transcriptional regulator [Veillonella sp.]